MSQQTPVQTPVGSDPAIWQAPTVGGATLAKPRQPTVMELLDRACSAGQPLEYLRELITLKERVDQHEEEQRKRAAIVAFNVAMNSAKIELPATIAKKQSTEFESRRTGTTTTYAYEGLEDILAVVVPVLAKHGLRHRYDIAQGQDGMTVTCFIVHDQGHHEEVTMRGPRDDSGSKNYLQSMGSTMTYLQRYTLKALLGLAGAKDDDAHASEGKSEVKRPQAAPDAMAAKRQADAPRPTKPAPYVGQATLPSATSTTTVTHATSTTSATDADNAEKRGAFVETGEEAQEVAALQRLIDINQFYPAWNNTTPEVRQRLVKPLALACAKRGEAYFRTFFAWMNRDERALIQTISTELRRLMDENQ